MSEINAALLMLRAAGYTVIEPLRAPEPGQVWANETETVQIERIDRAGVWVTWLRHPLITRPMEACSVKDVFKKWARETKAKVSAERRRGKFRLPLDIINNRDMMMQISKSIVVLQSYPLYCTSQTEYYAECAEFECLERFDSIPPYYEPIFDLPHGDGNRAFLGWLKLDGLPPTDIEI